MNNCDFTGGYIYNNTKAGNINGRSNNAGDRNRSGTSTTNSSNSNIYGGIPMSFEGFSAENALVEVEEVESKFGGSPLSSSACLCVVC